PSTSRGELPPLHTVAPKFSRSLPDLVCEVLIPHDGSGTRSGRAAFGGFTRSEARGRDGGGCPRGGSPPPAPGGGQACARATVASTVLLVSRADMGNNRT